MYHGDLEENRMTRELLKELLECIQMGIFFYPSLFFQKIRRL